LRGKNKKVMRIQGFQKLTLLDYPGKTAATIFTGGCNFRCPFCHNSALVTEFQDNVDIDESDVLKVLEKRRGFIDGVCITGGEPLIWQDIAEFIKKVKSLGLLVKLDTNGSYPERLENLIDSGLIDTVAMDIKNSPDAYELTVGIKGFDPTPILESVRILKDSKVDHEFRTTVVKEFHNLQRIEKIGKWLEGDDRYFLQCYRLSDGVIDKSLTPPEKEELILMLETVKPYLPNASIRGIDL